MLTERRWWFAAVGLALIVLAAVAWDRYPWTKHSCYWRAAQQPTEQGVNVASEICFQRFGYPSDK